MPGCGRRASTASASAERPWDSPLAGASFGRGRGGQRQEAPATSQERRRRDAVSADAARAVLLEARGLSVQFGGLKAVDKVFAAGAGRRHRSSHRTKWRRQDDVLQRYQPPPETFRRLCSFRRQGCHRCLHGRYCAPGLTRTFQNLRIHPNMTVLENVLGCHRHERVQVSGRWAGLASSTQRRERSAERPCGPCRSLGWKPWLISPPPACLTVPSDSPRSPGHSPPTRDCCCSTSRPPA